MENAHYLIFDRIRPSCEFFSPTGVKKAADEAKAEGQTEEAKVLSKAAKAASSTEEEISKWQKKLEETDKLIEKLAEDEEAASIDTNLSEERRYAQ